jgi:hypothetical protein
LSGFSYGACMKCVGGQGFCFFAQTLTWLKKLKLSVEID